MDAREEPRFEDERERMVERQLRARGVAQAEVLRALASVPRERFVPATVARRAYDDGALGIGGGQTISQPYMVARMTEALELPAWTARHPARPPAVLDIGTGSGYQAAVLATMGSRVTSVERDPELAASAEALLQGLGLPVEVVVADGSEGYPANAPYAGIVVAAAAPAIPDPLVDQLEDGGHLVIPIGTREHQQLHVVRRLGDRTQQLVLEPCVFVPLVGRYGFDGGSGTDPATMHAGDTGTTSDRRTR